MYAIIGERIEVYQELIGGPFENHSYEETIALFSTYNAAKEYIEKSRLKVPKKESFSSIKPFRQNSLLASYSNVWIENYGEETYPIDPEL